MKQFVQVVGLLTLARLFRDGNFFPLVGLVEPMSSSRFGVDMSGEETTVGDLDVHSGVSWKVSCCAFVGDVNTRAVWSSTQIGKSSRLTPFEI